MDTLAKLFGSPARVKIMRLFLLHREQGFEVREIAKRSKVARGLVKKEINLLKSAGFIKKKPKGWFLNKDFPQIEIIQILLIGSEIMKKEDVASRFKGVGKIKLLVVSGIFIQSNESRVDLLIVGDNLKRTQIDSVIKSIESELGKELAYALFETSEFIYRLDMYDKLIFDILDYPHERIIESRELSLPTACLPAGRHTYPHSLPKKS